MERRQVLAGIALALAFGLPFSSEAKPRRRRIRGVSGGASTRDTTADGKCPCNGGEVCVGPRGGRYCITGNGRKRYGV